MAGLAGLAGGEAKKSKKLGWVVINRCIALLDWAWKTLNPMINTKTGNFVLRIWRNMGLLLIPDEKHVNVIEEGARMLDQAIMNVNINIIIII